MKQRVFRPDSSGFLLFSVALISSLFSACKARPSPLGKHKGSCVVDYKSLSDPNAQATASEACSDHFEVWTDGDGLKVDLGDCTIHLKPPDKANESEWKLASHAPCLTKKGPARIDDGKLYLIGESFNLSFTGTTNDKRSTVTWGFTSDPTLR